MLATRWSSTGSYTGYPLELDLTRWVYLGPDTTYLHSWGYPGYQHHPRKIAYKLSIFVVFILVPYRDSDGLREHRAVEQSLGTRPSREQRRPEIRLTAPEVTPADHVTRERDVTRCAKCNAVHKM